MMISGLVLQVDPAATEVILSQVLACPGVSDLTVLEPAGQMVCVLEAASPEASAAVLGQMLQVRGVYAVMPAYIHEVEEDESWSSPAVHS